MRDLTREIYDWAGHHVQGLVRATCTPHSTKILDVGAGQGKYRYLLSEFRMDACEIWQPAVDEWSLVNLYDNVIVADYAEFVRTPAWDQAYYDVIIMGDVLEHIDRKRAQKALRLSLLRSREVIVVVPYQYPQGAEDGNEYQRHEQDDLTPESMVRYYPQLELYAVETRDFRPFKGIYRGRT